MFYFNPASYWPLAAVLRGSCGAPFLPCGQVRRLAVASVIAKCAFLSPQPKGCENGTHRFRLQKQIFTDDKNKPLVSRTSLRCFAEVRAQPR